MSLLSGIGSFFGKIFDAILKFLKKFWWVIVIILIILAVFFPAVLPAIWAFLQTAWTAVSGWIGTFFSTMASWASKAWSAAEEWVAEASFGEVLKLAAGAAVIVNPEGVADGVGSVVDTVVDGVASLVKDIPTSVWLIGGGLLAFWLFSGNSNDESTILIRSDEDQSSRSGGGSYEPYA